MEFLSIPLKPIKKEPPYALAKKKKAIRSMAVIHLFTLFDLPLFALATACYFWLNSFHWFIFTIAFSFIGYLQYLKHLHQVILQAPIAFKRHKNQINSAINNFNRQQYQLMVQKKSYLAFRFNLAIMQFDLAHLQESAKKRLKQQQLHTFLSEFTLVLAPIELAPETFALFAKLGVSHIGELDKINTMKKYITVGPDNYKALLYWRIQVLKGFEFKPQPYSLAKIQKQLRSELKSGICRFTKQEAKQAIALAQAYQKLALVYQQTTLSCKLFRQQRNRKAYLISVAALLDRNYGSATFSH